MDELFVQLKDTVYSLLEVGSNISDEELKLIIDEVIIQKSKASLISLHQMEILKKQIFNSIKKLDILQELIDDDSITEIMINGPENIFVEKNGHIQKWDKRFESKLKLEDIAQRIAAISNRSVNQANPIVDTRLNDGSRVNIVLAPIAINGPIITIRKFYKTPITMERLIEINSISREAAEFLRKAVQARYNIFISGGTGSGKTTFLNALSNYIPQDERVITIEDSAELQIQGINNIVRLETRNANAEGKNEISIRSLIKSSLRMRPDRIIVGEIRGAEALDMLQAMNTGHDGSLSTGHGNSPKDMISRITTMVLMGMDMPVSAIEQQICSALDIIVHLGRLRDKSRKILDIVEVERYEKSQVRLNSLYKFVEDSKTDGLRSSINNGKRIEGVFRKGNTGLINKDKMFAAGIFEW